MTIAVRELDSLDSANVAQGLAQVSSRVQEQNPSLDFRRGVNHDVLAYFHALLAEQQAVNIADYLAARSLKAIQEDPSLADPELADHVLSNFGVFRKEGSAATGEIAVVLSTDVTLTLVSGFRFQADGKLFATTRSYTAKKEAAQINDEGDRLLSLLADGTWRFTVPVVALEEGPASQLAKDVLATPLAAPANYVTSYAASGFTGGLAAETNSQLIARLQQGVACKAPSNRVNMQAMLRQIDAYSRVVATSIVGMGDAEMLRDKHWIFPVSGGGRVDWYIRAEERLTRKLLVKTATCVSVDASAGTSVWQVSISRDDAPGFYELSKIRRADASNVLGGFTVVSETRSLDLSGTGFVPDIIGTVEGDYTRFVAAVVRFTDSASGQEEFAAGQTASYQLEASCSALVAEIQDTISSADIRSRAADVLIKAPVPCFVSLAFSVYKGAAQADPDTDAIREALTSRVNAAGFAGKIYASDLQSAVAGFLLDGQKAGRIDMLARVRYPGGVVRHIRSSDILTVPDEPAKLVSRRTAQFFLDPSDIGIAIVTTAQDGQ